MNPQDPLLQLRDIHLPAPISWWPPAPGWWLLAILVVTLIVFSIRWWQRRLAQNCYRAEALQHLDELQLSLTNEPLDQCREILALLRRTAKTAYPQLSIESELTSAMLTRLNQCCATPVFDEEIQQQLGKIPYQKNPEISEKLIQKLRESTRQWLKKHQRVAPSC